jgi:pimeloyl-ACP methyl ester carboxylesterase
VKVVEAFVGPPPAPTHGDVADWIAGFAFSASKLSPVEYAFDARKLGLDMRVPFFIIHGRDDRMDPPEAAEAYLAEVRAPKKSFIPIPGGHWACFTDASAFVETLRQHVGPLAT